MQVFEPFEIQQFDVIVALKKDGLIEQDIPKLANYTREEIIALKDILYNKFEQIDFDMKVIFHALNRTLPYWSCLYPVSANDRINRKPQEFAQNPLLPKVKLPFFVTL